jgi:uncharacterized protein
MNELLTAKYPHPTKDVKKITTAISHVFLTGDYAYKICKPVNFGFLDFTTLEQRKEESEKSLALNSKLSDIYQAVVPITKSQTGLEVNGAGEVIEYALKMKQVDPESTMDNLLKRNEIGSEVIKQLAKKIFNFHQTAESNDNINQYGSLETVKFNWQENFDQTKECSLIEQDLIQPKVNEFLKKESMFNDRVSNGKIKKLHGDFHPGNVFIDNGIHIFDGIVFNERFPCSDVISEVAFMAMDLDYHNHQNLSQQFVDEYVILSGEDTSLLNFYKCYRAYVRAKVAWFTYSDPNLSDDQKISEKSKIIQYGQLAKSYSNLL